MVCLNISKLSEFIRELHLINKALTLFTGEIKQIDVNHLDKPDYLSAVKQKAISSGLIGESDFVCEWDV